MYNTEVNIIFMNHKTSKTADVHRSLLNLAEWMNFQKSDKYVALSNLSIRYAWKKYRKVI